MSAITSIEKKLKEAIDPTHLEVIDESYLHNVEPGRDCLLYTSDAADE